MTALTSGIFFVFTTYVIMQRFADDATKLGASGALLGDILTCHQFLVALVYFGAAIWSFACALASLNAFGRMLYSLGRYRFLHSSMGRVHLRHQTPYLALVCGAVLNFALCAAFCRNAELDTSGWYGTLASYGFIVVYLLCSVAAPVYLRKTGELTPSAIAFGAVGTMLMLLALLGSLYPVPAYPMNLLPYVFIIYMCVGAAWFFVLRTRSPSTLLHVEHDLEIADIPLGAKVL